MHQELIKELNLIQNPDNKLKQVLSLVKKRNYSGALLIACELCQLEDKPLMKFIEILLKYRKLLSIDINKPYQKNGKTPILFAAENKNPELYFMLEKAGANPDIPDYNQQTAQQIRNRNAQSAIEFLSGNLPEEYYKEVIELDLFFKDSTRLPDKNSIQSDHENSTYDIHRLKYMIARIDHLIKYFTNIDEGAQLPVTVTLDKFHEKCLHYLALRLSRQYLTEICKTMHNLSGQLRSKYNKLFEPQPFTWITLEQLGGIMTDKTQGRDFILPMGSFHTNDPSTVFYKGFTERFFQEITDTEQFIEEAVPYIINNDLPNLRKFLVDIEEHETRVSSKPVEKVCLEATKALTGRIIDNRSLLNLLNLLNYSDKEQNPMEKPRNFSDRVYVFRPALPKGEEYKKKFDLSRKSGKHAALRRLQLIGELITGKNFSSRLLELDETIDWRAFIAVRDGIIHQDERDNKHKIDDLLANVDILEHIVGTEFSDFWARLLELLHLREMHIGTFTEDPRNNWLKTLSAQSEEKSIHITPDLEKEDIDVRRVSQEEEEIFIASLIDKNAPDEVIKLFRGLFDGTGTIPPRKELGPIQGKYMPSRTENKKLSEKLSQILKKATGTETQNRSSVIERNEKRRAQEEAARKREEEKESKFKGLDCLRDLAKSLSSQNPNKDHFLNPLKRVEASIEALANIEEFLLEEGYIIHGYPYTSQMEWDAFHVSQSHLPLVQLLAVNHELNDAIEYNMGQLLQHLDTVHKHPASRCSKYLHDNYESLRILRNYIEHGDPLLDNPGDDDNQEVIAYRKYLRQMRIAPVIVELIFKLKKDLVLIYEATLNPVLQLDQDNQSQLSEPESEKEKGAIISPDSTENEIKKESVGDENDYSSLRFFGLPSPEGKNDQKIVRGLSL